MSRAAWSLSVLMLLGGMIGGWCAPAPADPEKVPLFPAEEPINELKPLLKTRTAYFPNCDAGGRYLIFNSYLNGFIKGDNNKFVDLFAYDLQTDEITKVTLSSTGEQTNNHTFEGRLSADGRYAVFGTIATNLVPGDSNKVSDIFLRDRTTGTTTRISVGTDGRQADYSNHSTAINADGRYIVFTSQAHNLGGPEISNFKVYLRDQQTGEVTYVGRGNGGVRISADGNVVLFGCSFGEEVGLYIYHRKTKATTRVDVALDGGEPDMEHVGIYDLSADGRYIVFASNATNLVPGDTNDNTDIFLHDTVKMTTRRINVSNDGIQADEDSGLIIDGKERMPGLAISGDGRWVVYTSKATNLVPDDADKVTDVFLYDVPSQTTTCLSVDATGHPSGGMQPCINGDGSYIFFLKAPNEGPFHERCLHALIRKPLPAVTVPVSIKRELPNYERIAAITGGEAGGGITALAMSEDGRYVAFSSNAKNLAPGDNNEAADVFVRDRQLKLTVRASMGLNGKQADRASGDKGLCFSGNGRYLAYSSAATNLVVGDSNFRDDIFLCDIQTGKTRRVSVGGKGEQANGMSRSPALTRDGRYLAFTSAADNLVAGDTNESWDIFVSDWQTGKLLRVSTAADGAQADDDSTFPSISADGRYIAFVSAATNLTAGDANGKRDIFLHDLKTHAVTRVSVSSTGAEADGDSTAPVVSADGRYVLFVSAATNLVEGDTNEKPDVFLRDCQTGATVRISTASGGVEANGTSGFCTMTPDARYITFISDAGNLVDDDTNGGPDLFLYDRDKKKLRCLSLTPAGKTAVVLGITPSINIDGKYLLLVSDTPLTPGAKDQGRSIYFCDQQPKPAVANTTPKGPGK
ncbi:MAG: TolB family protein [Armatimonadota bacterium]